MILRIQIICLLFSFLFGIFLYIVFKFNRKILFIKNKYFRLFVFILLLLIISLFFFLIIKYFNDGILHYYFLLFIIFGFLMTYKIDKKL